MTFARQAIRWAALATAAASCNSGPGSGPAFQGLGTLLYDDVSMTDLPAGVLDGLSMDARPVDVDADGDLDIVVASEFATNILLVNNGNGRFTDGSARIPQSIHDSEDIGAGDFDADGDIDLVIVSEDDQINELYLNNGSGTFSDASSRIPVMGTSNAVLVADFDDDAVPDILIGNNGQNVLLLNDGNGQFVNETTVRLPPINDVTQDIESGDIDNDGDLDLIVANEGANRILVNDGTGVFAEESSARLPLRTTPEETREADFGDADGDGDLDIFFANVTAFVGTADPANRLLINDGAGVFTDETASRLPTDRDNSFDGDFIDIDGDGDLDIVTSNTLFGGIGLFAPYRVLVNDGTGTFDDRTEDVFPSTALGLGFDVEAGDFDGDGLTDLYLAGRGSPDILLKGR